MLDGVYEGEWAMEAIVLWGERDDFLPSDTVARPLAERLRAQLIKLPGGHFTPLDCPTEVAAALRDFVACLPFEIEPSAGR